MNYMAPPKPPLSIQVEAQFDDEAKVWVATSDDVPGLVAEHANFGELENMVLDLIPLLLAENGLIPHVRGESYQIPVHIAASSLTRRNAIVAN